MRAFIVMLLLASGAAASAPYTYRDGAYYGADGHKYTRKQKWVWVDGYYYTKNCCRYWQEGYWQTNGYDYERVVEQLSYKDPAWRTKLLEIAAQRDRFEGQLRAAANEQNAFIESVRELGLTGNFYWQQYGVAPQLAGHHSSYAVAGNTLYSVFQNSSVVDVYGQANPDLIFQQASAHTKYAFDLAGQGSQQFVAMANAERDRASRIGETIARGQAAAQALQAAQGSSTHIRNTQTEVRPLQAQGGRLRAMRACIECHGDQNPEGGYRVSQHWTLSAKDQMRVVERLTLGDDDPKRMPKDQPRLSSDLILEFLPAADRARLGR